MNRLNEITGVENATLVSYNGEYMSRWELLRDNPGSAEKITKSSAEAFGVNSTSPSRFSGKG